MKIRELYEEAIRYEYYSLVLIIDFLVREKKVLSLDDDAEKIDYYFQPKFKRAMYRYLDEYNEKTNIMKPVPMLYYAPRQNVYVLAYDAEQAKHVAKTDQIEVAEEPLFYVTENGIIRMTRRDIRRKAPKIPYVFRGR
ncbi:hypothetical protein HNR63_001067 [Anoxybacillus kamchatkensis]|uniref:hypothetical protein n=1 Tax=Anoxybacillus ayderensis TaxID=265546 RepID=UPI0015EB30D6|nr:hypothetical protein [Anoxybacillus ayderensis]MBA2878013.1 hypothetical protein [Anoxybacillus ayderensis]